MMKEIHKKIEDYVENVDGPFFTVTPPTPRRKQSFSKE